MYDCIYNGDVKKILVNSRLKQTCRACLNQILNKYEEKRTCRRQLAQEIPAAR